MVKVSSSDVLDILRKFHMADKDNVPRHIENISFSNPDPINTLISFKFNKYNFYILFDDTAEDDTSYILSQVQTDKQDIQGEVIQNPNDSLTTYALPYKGKEVYLFEVISNKTRLDVYLAEKYPDISRSTWQKHIKAGHVKVNGVVKVSPKQDVIATDTIDMEIPEMTDFTDEKLPVLYQDENVVVVNKPIGVLTHSKGALNDEFTVADFFKPLSSYHSDTNRPGIVHRLDRDTSGVIIGARNDETATLLQRQFAQRRTKKTYLAIVEGMPKESQAKIDLPIGRNPSAPSTFRVDPKGKSAVTEYTVLASNGTQSLLELRPRTGRTHQLRVHTSYIGCPIIGDRVYGKPADRLYLHAYQLEVTIPEGRREVFTAPIPAEFIAKFPSLEDK